jgi:hypothetical protein
MSKNYTLKTVIKETPGHGFEDTFKALRLTLPRSSGTIDELGEFEQYPYIKLADNRVLLFGPHFVADLEEAA